MPARPGPGTVRTFGSALNQSFVDLAVTMAGARQPTSRTRRIGGGRTVAGTVYGLVNVRTDGRRILCATMDEATHTWQVKEVTSRF